MCEIEGEREERGLEKEVISADEASLPLHFTD